MQDERMNGREQEKRQILDLFRKKGMRITKQRELILDIVLENECSCCKEIYYRAAKKDKNIGIATVYRMINALGELGLFRQNMPYCLAGRDSGESGNGCKIFLKNQSVVELNFEEWRRVLLKALEEKGYSDDVEIDHIILK